MIAGFFGQIGDLIVSGITAILNVLPDSPFVMLQSNAVIAGLLPYVNYFIPINFMVSTLELWLVSVGIFYIWQVILRWVKAIE